MSASLCLSVAARFRLLRVGLTILVSWGGNSHAAVQSVTLAWDPAANAAGYRLYSGTTSRVYTQQINVGNTTSTLVSNLIAGQRYFFAVTAYTTAGMESTFSNEISYTPGAPTPTPTPTPRPSPTPTPSSTPTPSPTPTATATPISTVQITVQTNPVGLDFTVDGTHYTASKIFSWRADSSHTIATTSTQVGSSVVRYVWSNWSDNGGISHSVAPTTNKTYTAKFTTQYYLTMTAGTGGTVTPTSGWQNSGSVVSITARPATGYSFASWKAIGTGSFSGTKNPASATMSGPITESATFTHN